MAGACTRRALLALALGGCAVGVPLASAPMGEPAAGRVAVVARGWHTDLCLGTADLIGPLSRMTAGWPGVRYLSFGFGERQYLLTDHPGPWEMLSALLPSRSAILMTALNAPPAEAFGAENVVVLGIGRIGLARLSAFIWDALETGADGAPLRLRDGPYPGSVYYAAFGTYDALTTCNTWTASGLRAAGLPVDPAVLFAGQVMRQARRVAAAQAAALAAAR